MVIVNDREWRFLSEQTGLSLTFNDMYFRYLRGLGYEGTLQDMIASSGLGFTPSQGEMIPPWLTDLNPDATWGLETVSDGQSYRAGPISISRASVGWANNLAGIYNEFSNNIPRMTDRGLTIEREETNFAHYGTSPATWSNSQPAGITASKSSVTIDGLPGVKILFLGTASAAGEIAINPTNFDAGAVATQGQTWRASAKARMSDGVLPAVLRVGCFERNASNGLIGQTYAEFTGLGTTLQEARAVRTFNDAAAARATNSIRCAVAQGQTINFTIELTDAHLTQLQPSSTPVLTTGTSSATRLADQLSLPIPTGQWDINVTFATGGPEQVFSGVSGPNWTPDASLFTNTTITAIYGTPV